MALHHSTPESASTQRKTPDSLNVEHGVCEIAIMKIMRCRLSLKQQLTRDLDLDDPMNTVLRRQVIRSKPILEAIYMEWYAKILQSLGDNTLNVLELGSGAGFLEEYLPNVTTSEVFPLEGIDTVIDATKIDLPDSSLDAIVMTDVLHHIPNIDAFLSEAIRTLRPGGRVVMIEPWNTKWSKPIFKYLHHEPFNTQSQSWDLPIGGPLSNANGALPWIVFVRDRQRLNRLYPQLRIVAIEPLMPISYLISGGLATSINLPKSIFKIVRRLESGALRERGAMFALIVLQAEK